jgi:hypothetical protein
MWSVESAATQQQPLSKAAKDKAERELKRQSEYVWWWRMTLWQLENGEWTPEPSK